MKTRQITVYGGGMDAAVTKALAGVFALRKLLYIITAGTLLLCTACDNGTSSEPSGPPALTGVVTINNASPAVGDTLTASYSGGNGTGTPTWEWLANDVAISGANSYIYEVALGDQSKTLKARVSYADQSGSVTSAATTAVATKTKDDLTGAVSISNTDPEVGDTLTAAYSGGNGSGTETWQWLADDAPIYGANSSTYVVVSGDEGKTLKARVSYDGQSGSITSAATTAVGPKTKPDLTGTVAINNTNPKPGDTLTASYTGGNGSGTQTWQWLANDIAINGANSNTYTVADEDTGKTLKARVSYSEQSGSVTSSATSSVLGTFRIRITGIPAAVMADGGAGKIQLLLFTQNALAASTISMSNNLTPLAGRNPSADYGIPAYTDNTDYTGQSSGTFYYEFTFWDEEESTPYVDQAGNYDIGFIRFFNFPPSGPSDLEVKAISNRPLSVSTVNTFAYGDFLTKTITSSTSGLQYELLDEYNCNYEYDSSVGYYVPVNIGTYRVVSGFGTSGAVTIPATYNDAAVTEIGEEAFKHNGSITGVTIPASIKAIRYGAIEDCNNLATVTFASGSQLTTIDMFAFAWCSKLTNITIPASVQHINGNPFAGCTNLANINVAAGNSRYSSQSGILYNSDKTELVAYPSASGNVTNIPSSVTTIGGAAFAACYNLTGVTIPASVEYISWNAFFQSNNITNITIPATVGRIEQRAFSDWTSSQTITIQGYTDQQAADTAWGNFWRDGCEATIVYAGIGVGSISVSTWREGNVVTLTTPTLNLPGGISAQGWQISNDGNSWSDYTPPSTANLSDKGKYLRYYATSGGQTYYSNIVTLRVLSTTEREVTIAMWDDWGDGWNGAALRINVNGVDLANATLDESDGSSGYYWFAVDSDDLVKLYWISGDYDYEISFAVYYSGDPGNLLIEHHSGNYLGDDTLMGEFTVP